jgi:hypothetical protein
MTQLQSLSTRSCFFVVGLLLNGSAEVQGAPSKDLNSTIPIGGGAIHLTVGQPLPVSQTAVKDWVVRAATALTRFYGHYPVKEVEIDVLPASSGAVQGGRELDGVNITIHLGEDTTPADLSADWMMTHEMFHLSQPDLDEDYSWMSEGMADYLEPVARVRVGQISVERFWKDQVEGLPNGLPQDGDHGLDRTHTWGRTYWGGSLYWLLADIGVRRQTQNQRSVRDAAAAAQKAGGDGSQQWSIGRLLKTYDKGTGTTVFTDLHNQMGTKPVHTDLDALWKSLGVIYKDGQIAFDDHAPLAGIRRGITEAAKD